MTTIYRVENANGRGMYRAGGSYSALEFEFDEYIHPMPSSDDALMRSIQERGEYNECGSLDYSMDDYFGFSSLDQLKRWIYRDDWRSKLDAAGFHVSVYSAVGACIGDTQAVFLLHKSICVNQLRLTEI